MILENQVVSLELAKKIKELGFEQESYFMYSTIKTIYGRALLYICESTITKSIKRLIKEQGTDQNVIDGFFNATFNEDVDNLQIKTFETYSAYTVAELGEMLPEDFTSTKGAKWRMWLYGDEEFDPVDGNGTEADSRAKMLIYLKENNLI